MPPKTRKIPLTNQLEARYRPDTGTALNTMSPDQRDDTFAQMEAERVAREQYAMQMNMSVGAVVDPAQTDVYINRIGNTPQNVVTNRLGETNPRPIAPPQDPRRKSSFARMTPLAMALVGMLR